MVNTNKTTAKTEINQADLCYNKLEIIADTAKGMNDLNKLIAKCVVYNDMHIKLNENCITTYDTTSELTSEGVSMFGADGTDNDCYATDMRMIDEDGKASFRMLTLHYSSNSSLKAFSKLAKTYTELNFVKYTQSNISRGWNDDTAEAYTKIYTYKKGVKQPNDNDYMAVVFDFDSYR